MTAINKKILALALMFMLPGFLACWFYLHPDHLPGKPTNQGELLTPPVSLPFLPQAEKWQLMLWQPTDCDKICRQQLDELARIRLALGRKLYQVRIILLLGAKAEPLPKGGQEQLRQVDIHWQQLHASQQEKLPVFGGKPQVFIADRKGYLILSYSHAQKPEAVFKDLKKLL